MRAQARSESLLPNSPPLLPSLVTSSSLYGPEEFLSQRSSEGTSGAGEVGSGRSWERRQRRRLEDEEGAGAALSVLRVVPTLPKCHHQEVTQEGPAPGRWPGKLRHVGKILSS